MTNDGAILAEVDARGMRCPWPALRLARAMRGEHRVRLIADDPHAAREIAALASEHGWHVFAEPGAAGRWLIRRT